MGERARIQRVAHAPAGALTSGVHSFPGGRKVNSVQEFISITPWTIIFQICNLLILFALIRKFLFKRVMAVLEARQKEIDGIYDAAGKDRQDAAQMKE